MKAVVALIAVLLAIAARVEAHGEQSPLAAAVELDVKKVQVVLRWWIDAGAVAQELREHFDTDADGAIDAAEQQALRAWLLAQARAAFALEVRGARVPLTLAVATVDLGDGPSGHVALAARFVGEVSWVRGDNAVVVHAETKAKAASPVTIYPGPKSKLATSRKHGDASPGAPLTLTVTR